MKRIFGDCFIIYDAIASCCISFVDLCAQIFEITRKENKVKFKRHCRTDCKYYQKFISFASAIKLWSNVSVMKEWLHLRSARRLYCNKSQIYTIFYSVVVMPPIVKEDINLLLLKKIHFHLQ